MTKCLRRSSNKRIAAARRTTQHIIVTLETTICAFFHKRVKPSNDPSSGTAAERDVEMQNTNKSHKINRNWQGQRLLPAAPLLALMVLSPPLERLSELEDQQ